MPDNLDTTDPSTAPKPGPRNAKNGEKPSTSWVIPGVTAVALIAVFCIYYFVYVSARCEYLTNRNFRALAVLGEQLQTMISSHGSILEFYADLEGNRHSAHDRRKEILKKFLVIRHEDKNLPTAQQQAEAQKDCLRYLTPNFEITTEEKSKVPEPASRLQAQRHDGRWELVLTAEYVPKEKKYYRGSLDLDGLLTPLMGSLPFDEIVLVSEKGTIVYQNKKAGPQFTTLTSLLQAQPTGAETKPAGKEGGAPSTPAKDDSKVVQNADPTWRTTSKNLTDVLLAGTRYKLFLQPVLVDVFSDDPNHDEPAREWVLCGLRSAAALQWESLSISYLIIIWFTALFFAISMSGLVFKIFFLNHRERLRVRDLGFLGLFLVLLTSVFTLSGLQAVDFPLNDDTEKGLQQLGETLSNNIRKELRDMRDQLKNWCDDGALKDDLARAEKAEVIRNKVKPDTESLIDRTPDARRYSYVNNAFWTDDDGHQVVKWSLSDYVTPMIDVSTLSIYTHSKTIYLDNKPPAFYFDSVQPPNKLEYLAAVTMTTKDCLTNAPPSIRGDITGGSAFLTAQPLSLIDPILPLGYGFALVDQSGLVLFHADKTKNLRENFRQESDWNQQLYAATFGHATPHSLLIKYLGTDYRARVMPIPGVSQSPWSLIVYRDLTPVRTINLQVMTMATTLVVLILAGPIFVLAIWGLIHRPRFAPDWLWPNQARMGAYLYQISLYTLLILLFLFLGFGGSGEQTVIACAATPYIALLLTWWCFRLCPSAEQPSPHAKSSLAAPAMASIIGAILFLGLLVSQRDYLKALTSLLVFGIIAAVPLLYGPRHHLIAWINHRAEENLDLPPKRLFAYRNCYVLSALLLLLLTGVLMPMALFHASLNVERRLELKQAQLHLASALSSRLLQVTEQHERGDLGDAAYAKFTDNDIAVWSKIVYDPLFPANSGLPLVEHSRPPGKELYSGWFQGLIYLVHHDYNDSAAQMLGVIPDRIDPKSGDDFSEWSWSNDESSSEYTNESTKKSSTTLRWHGIHPPASDDPAAETKSASEKDLSIKSDVPAATRADVYAGVAIAAGVILVIGTILWALARKLFLFEVAPVKMTGARQVAEFIREGRNVVILLPPVSDWQLDAPKFTLDLTAMATGPEWGEAFDLDKVPLNTVIEIRPFEYTTNDAEIDNQKVILLQRLLGRENTQLAVVMTVPVSAKDYRRAFPAFEVIDLREQPFYWLKRYEGPARDLIWKECGPLAALWPIGAQLAKDIKTEAIYSEDTIASEILERADAYYGLVWKECSKEQKFVLAQLAQDGLPNPTNRRTIGQLVRRGLIVKDPQFRIMNESFRRFLRSATTVELKQEWLSESRGSGWGKVHGTFFATMILLGAFLLTTQNSLWQSVAAYVTTALGALGTLGKLFNTFRGGTTPEKPG